MLDEYRRWLESELKLLGNASHHAYSFGQANMAKRAIEKLDETLAAGPIVGFSKDEASTLTAELAALETAGGSLPPGLLSLRDSLVAALRQPSDAP